MDAVGCSVEQRVGLADQGNMRASVPGRMPFIPRSDSAITRAGMREALLDKASCVGDMSLNSVRAGASKFEKQQRQEGS